MILAYQRLQAKVKKNLSAGRCWDGISQRLCRRRDGFRDSAAFCGREREKGFRKPAGEPCPYWFIRMGAG